MPAHLRDRLATTAEQVALTFTLAAQVRAWIAARSTAEADDHHSRAAWNQLVPDFVTCDGSPTAALGAQPAA